MLFTRITVSFLFLGLFMSPSLCKKHVFKAQCPFIGGEASLMVADNKYGPFEDIFPDNNDSEDPDLKWSLLKYRKKGFIRYDKGERLSLACWRPEFGRVKNSDDYAKPIEVRIPITATFCIAKHAGTLKAETYCD